MTYVPKPVDTTSIQLPAELQALTERLAENTHEVWARRKLADGWVPGATVDPVAKRHPNLVPYDQLTDDKKAYDRDSALETLKLILALGFTIELPRK